jgi:hypothetical protein
VAAAISEFQVGIRIDADIAQREIWHQMPAGGVDITKGETLPFQITKTLY